jgi:hypothetical protein
MSEALEIHCEERDVGCNVVEAKAVVELKAIENPRSIIEAVDVIGLKVPMSIADLTVGDPPREQSISASQETSHARDEGVMSSPVDDRTDEARHRNDVRLELPSDFSRRGVSRDLVRPIGASVEISHDLGHPSQLVCPNGFGLRADHAGQRALGGQATHHDDVIERLPLHREVGDSQVDVGCQSAIERDLAPAVFFPSSPRREVGEVEEKRLAQF